MSEPRPTAPVVLRGGQPSPQELAAIVAAVELAWPKVTPAVQITSRSGDLGRWRWSGRWWAPRQVAARRTRP